MFFRCTLLIGILLISLCFPAQGENLVEAITGKDFNQVDFLEKNAINGGAWISMGGNYSTDNPSNHNNLPITFNDRTGEFQLNQVNVFLQRSIDQGSASWDFGGRIDAMYGTDSNLTQANGWDQNLIGNNTNLGQYNIAIPQAYLEIFAPFGNGVTAKIGHFYTIIGHEVVMAPSNFFYSHSYAMQYGEPFTNSGVLFEYSLNDNFTLSAGTVSGWDNLNFNFANMNFLGGLSWVNDEATDSVSWSVISGDVQNTNSENRTMYSLVASHSFNEQLHYVFQHDFGYQAQSTTLNTDGYWYGINQYMFYDFTNTFSGGLRGEWFRDNNGTRLNIGSSGSYFELTAGVNWKPRDWFTLRPEVRYDWADSNVNTYSNQTKNNELEFAVDVILEL